MVKKISTRLANLEARLIRPRQPKCEECGREGGGPIIWETHHPDGVVSYDPCPPCPGCARLAASTGRTSRIIICPHGCWCKEDKERIAAAPKVDPSMGEEFQSYESGAAKYERRLREKRALEDEERGRA